MSKQAILDKIAEVSFKDEETGDELVYVGDVEFILTAHEGEWISVEDRLPEQDDDYLVSYFVDDDVCMDVVKFYKGAFRFYGWNLDPAVTHWMPLPAPPEEGE